MANQAFLLPAAGAPAHARLRSMVDAHLDSVWRALRRLGVPEAQVDDATQQVFMVASRRLAEIEVGRERPYLLGVALRVSSEARRASQRRREVPMADGPEGMTAQACSPDQLLDEKRALQALQAVLDELPPDLRETFVLFELEELSAPEVASVVGVPVGTVASRVRRARVAVREALTRARRDP